VVRIVAPELADVLVELLAVLRRLVAVAQLRARIVGVGRDLRRRHGRQEGEDGEEPTELPPGAAWREQRGRIGGGVSPKGTPNANRGATKFLPSVSFAFLLQADRLGEDDRQRCILDVQPWRAWHGSWTRMPPRSCSAVATRRRRSSTACSPIPRGRAARASTGRSAAPPAGAASRRNTWSIVPPCCWRPSRSVGGRTSIASSACPPSPRAR